MSAVALLAVGGAACSSVLGLAAPTLDPCIDGCPDGSLPPTTEDSGSSPETGSSSGGSSGGSSSGGDSAVEAAPPHDVATIPDVIIDRGPSTGVRCGTGASEIFCAGSAAWCCLVLDDAGDGSYTCTSNQSSCDALSGYPIQCASNADCTGTDICCIYGSAIKCEPEGTSSCVIVCDPNGPSDQCSGNKTCGPPSPPFSTNGYPLPYDGCQ